MPAGQGRSGRRGRRGRLAGAGCGRVVRAGELGEAGYQEPVGYPGEEQGDGQAVGGDLVGAAMRDAFDDLVGAQPAQVVADLAAGHVLWRFPELGGEVVPQVAAGEAGGPEREGAAGAQEGLDGGSGNRIPGMRVQVVLMTGLVIASSTAAPSAGSWLMHSASSTRRLAA